MTQQAMTPYSSIIIPYSDEALCNDLIRVRDAWRESRRRHDRYSIYRFLAAVFELVLVWRKENQAIRRAKRALFLSGRIWSGQIEPFAVVIFCTSSRKEVDVKARSKWAHVLMFAELCKPRSEKLEHFIRRCGGINLCATALNRLGRNQNQLAKKSTDKKNRISLRVRTQNK